VAEKEDGGNNMTRSFLTGVALTCLTAGPLWAEPANYATPFDALEGMISALQATDRTAVLTVFGPENEDLISGGDLTEDANNRIALLGLYREGYRLEPQEDGSVVFAFGADGWPFPVPLVRGTEGWSFDAEAGHQEVVDRALGLNEIEVMDLLEAYVDVQADFRRADHDGDGVMEFARQIISSAETRDGLFWPGQDSPLGERLARASESGFNDGTQDRAPEPYLGYYFRILTSQGDAAPGGALAYLVNGNMVAGHAILAVPAAFGETGVHSFMVSENGVILEADLGEDTLEIAATIEAFDPGSDWTPVK
jgi:hypothetical protein